MFLERLLELLNSGATSGHIETTSAGPSGDLANRPLIMARTTELVNRIASAEHGRAGHGNAPSCQPSRQSAPPASPRPSPTRHGRWVRRRNDSSAKQFQGDTLAGLRRLSNGTRDALLFRRELGVGQCPSDGVRVVHTDIVLRRPRYQTADRVTHPPGRRKLWSCPLVRRGRRRGLGEVGRQRRVVAPQSTPANCNGFRVEGSLDQAARRRRLPERRLFWSVPRSGSRHRVLAANSQ